MRVERCRPMASYRVHRPAGSFPSYPQHRSGFDASLYLVHVRRPPLHNIPIPIIRFYWTEGNQALRLCICRPAVGAALRSPVGQECPATRACCAAMQAKETTEKGSCRPIMGTGWWEADTRSALLPGERLQGHGRGREAGKRKCPRTVVWHKIVDASIYVYNFVLAARLGSDGAGLTYLVVLKEVIWLLLLFFCLWHGACIMTLQHHR